jgi:RimJ/RimL family protein N-acetyltransferase
MLKTLLRAYRNFDEIARAYYGQRPWCYPKYLYYSLLRINEFVLFRKDLAPTDGDPFAGTEFEIKRIPIEELKQIREKENLPKEFYCDVSHGWKTCYVVLHHGEIAHVIWVCYPSERSRFFRCKGAVAELNYNITLPRFRGHGLSVRAMDHICEAERSRGIEVMLGVVHSQNIAMIKCMKKSGFAEVGTTKSLGQWNRKTTVTASDG